MEPIEPNVDAIDSQRLLASLVCDVVVINRGLGVNADRRQLCEDAVRLRLSVVCRMALISRFRSRCQIDRIRGGVTTPAVK